MGHEPQTWQWTWALGPFEAGHPDLEGDDVVSWFGVITTTLITIPHHLVALLSPSPSLSAILFEPQSDICPYSI